MSRHGRFSPVLGILLVALALGVGGLVARAQPGQAAQAARTIPTTQGASSPSALVGHPWKLVAMTYDGHAWTLDPSAAVTITFAASKASTEGPHANGSGGCNSYGAAYTATPGHLRVGEMVSTAMACLYGNIMAQENHYLQALRDATTFSVTASGLTLSDASGQNVLRFVAG